MNLEFQLKCVSLKKFHVKSISYRLQTSIWNDPVEIIVHKYGVTIPKKNNNNIEKKIAKRTLNYTKLVLKEIS